MTTAPYGRRRAKPPKIDPLSAPIADEAAAVPAADRVVTSQHNQPPSPVDSAVREFKDALGQRDGFAKRIEQVIAAAGRAVATDQDTSGRCAELVRQIGAVVKVIEDTRKFVKDPYFQAGKAVDTAASAMKGPLEDAEAKVRRTLNDFVRAEEAKRRKAEADARAAEAARRREEERRLLEAEQARKAAEKAGEPIPEPEPVPEYVPPPAREAVPERTQVRGDYGAVASASKEWKAEIIDWNKAFKAVSSNEQVREAIQKAINRRVKAGDRTIAGVNIFEDVGLRVR